MQQCSGCDHSCPDTAKFCENCGRELARSNINPVGASQTDGQSANSSGVPPTLPSQPGQQIHRDQYNAERDITIIQTFNSPATEATPEPTTTAQPSGGTFKPFRDEFHPILRPEWRIVAAGFSINQGKLIGDRGTIVYDQEGSSYVIKTRVKGLGRFGIMFRRTPNLNNGYTFRCDQHNCRWYILTDGGRYQAISSKVSRSAAFSSRNFHELTLEIKGRNFTALVDGQPFSSVTDETYMSGVVGLYADYSYGKTVVFDFFELAPLP